MPRQAIKQAEHESCEVEDSEFSVTDTNFPEDSDAIMYDVRCSCGEEGKVVVGDTVAASDGISYENATWNEEDEE